MQEFQNDIDRIYASIKESSRDIRLMNEQIILLRIEVASLKVRSGVWGFAAGAVPALLFLVLEMLKK